MKKSVLIFLVLVLVSSAYCDPVHVRGFLPIVRVLRKAKKAKEKKAEEETNKTADAKETDRKPASIDTGEAARQFEALPRADRKFAIEDNIEKIPGDLLPEIRPLHGCALEHHAEHDFYSVPNNVGGYNYYSYDQKLNSIGFSVPGKDGQFRYFDVKGAKHDPIE